MDLWWARRRILSLSKEEREEFRPEDVAQSAKRVQEVQKFKYNKQYITMSDIVKKETTNLAINIQKVEDKIAVIRNSQQPWQVPWTLYVWAE